MSRRHVNTASEGGRQLSVATAGERRDGSFASPQTLPGVNALLNGASPYNMIRPTVEPASPGLQTYSRHPTPPTSDSASRVLRFCLKSLGSPTYSRETSGLPSNSNDFAGVRKIQKARNSRSKCAQTLQLSENLVVNLCSVRLSTEQKKSNKKRSGLKHAKQEVSVASLVLGAHALQEQRLEAERKGPHAVDALLRKWQQVVDLSLEWSEGGQNPLMGTVLDSGAGDHWICEDDGSGCCGIHGSSDYVECRLANSQRSLKSRIHEETRRRRI